MAPAHERLEGCDPSAPQVVEGLVVELELAALGASWSSVSKSSRDTTAACMEGSKR